MASNNENSGSHHATMADVAARVGVSRQLVGLAFRHATGVSAETKAKIFVAAEEIGYQPNFAAQSLRRDGSKYIGLAYHTSHSSSEDLLPAIYAQAEYHGFNLMLSAISQNREDQDAINEIIGHRCDGAILISSSLSIATLKRIATKMPLVSISRRVKGVKCGVVASNGESGVLKAVEYLLSLGHKEIAYVDTNEMFEHEFRLEGYLTAMRKANLPTSVITISGDYIESSGAEAAERFLAERKLPTAIVCANDQVALGLVYTFQKAGVRVPTDVSVVGYDDTISRLPFLDFTTVHQDAGEIAEAAVKDLAERIKGRTAETQIHLTSANLVVRSSTAKPREHSAGMVGFPGS